MRKMSLSLAMFVGIASAAYAQDGGKLPWKDSKKNPQGAMAEAKKAGKPMLLFFTSEG